MIFLTYCNLDFIHKKSHESIISVLLIYRLSDTQSDDYQSSKSLDQVTTSHLRNQTIEVRNHKLFMVIVILDYAIFNINH